MTGDKYVLQLTESIKNAINEEFGIADEVTDALYTIKEELKKSFKNEFEKPTRVHGITYRSGNFETNIFGEKLTVYWECYNYQNENLKNQHILPATGRYIKKDGNETAKLLLSMQALRGKININKTLESTRHEIHHFYEDAKNGFKPFQKRELYKYACDLMNSFHYTDIRHMIGNIIYISFEHEQRAFYNGAYEFLLANIDVAYNFNLKIQETQMFKHMEYLKECIEEVENIGQENWEKNKFIKDISSHLKDEYNITYDKLLKIAHKSLKNLSLKIGRAIIKAKIDYDREQYITFDRS